MPSIKINVGQVDHSASLAQARDHSLTMDRPEAKGGQNKGPMGGEALLMGLGGCFMSNLLAAAVAREIKIEDAKTEITAEMADSPVRFTDIHMKVTATCDAPDQMQKLVTVAERGCLVANTLGKAVNLTFEAG